MLIRADARRLQLADPTAFVEARPPRPVMVEVSADDLGMVLGEASNSVALKSTSHPAVAAWDRLRDACSKAKDAAS